MAVADGTLYTGGDEVRATATTDGTIRWRFEHEAYSSAYAGPVVATGTLYVTNCVKQRPTSLYDQAMVALGER
jgi:outer membrane protein assembly factor BamB